MTVQCFSNITRWDDVFTQDTLVDLLCQNRSSLINRQVLQGSLLFASGWSEKYLRLAFFIALLALFLASLNCFQIERSFVDAAFFFRKSLLWISRNSSLEIHGDRLFLTLFVLNDQDDQEVFPEVPHFIWVIVRCNAIPVNHAKSSQKYNFIEILDQSDFHSFMH